MEKQIIDLVNTGIGDGAWVETIGNLNVAPAAREEIQLAQKILNLRRVKNLLEGFEKKYKEGLEKLFRRRKTPLHVGYVKVQWSSKKYLDSKKVEAFLTENGLEAEMPNLYSESDYIDVRRVKDIGSDQ